MHTFEVATPGVFISPPSGRALPGESSDQLRSTGNAAGQTELRNQPGYSLFRQTDLGFALHRALPGLILSASSSSSPLSNIHAQPRQAPGLMAPSSAASSGHKPLSAAGRRPSYGHCRATAGAMVSPSPLVIHPQNPSYLHSPSSAYNYESPTGALDYPLALPDKLQRDFSADTNACQAAYTGRRDMLGRRPIFPVGSGSQSQIMSEPSVARRAAPPPVNAAVSPRPAHGRQPAKSPYALWVGNLPPRPTLLELRNLFGTPDILSIYLIDRTGCAFINYRSEAGLEEGRTVFESRGGRIRDHKLVVKAQKHEALADNDRVASPRAESESSFGAATSTTSVPRDRYFICKSLTLKDLQTAEQTLQWSTQSRNRAKFNEAFQESENIYFVFSANRTSAFYGIARMESLLPDTDAVPVVARPDDPSPDAERDEAATRVVPTPAVYDPASGLEYPAGSCVEDTVRGCVFWEAEGCGAESAVEEDESRRWTAPCKISWISPHGVQLSFMRTKHLRNPLNGNKPVKIARDGTEIARDVGAELTSLFMTRRDRSS